MLAEAVSLWEIAMRKHLWLESVGRVEAVEVAIALCGATGAGTVAGLSFDAVEGSSLSAGESDVRSIQGCAPLFLSTRNGSEATGPLQILNFGTASSTRPDLSLLVVNAVPEDSQQVKLAHELVSLVPADSEVVVMASVHLGSGKGAASLGGGLQVAALNGFQLPEPLDQASALPGSAKLQDGVLAALMHFLIASGTPSCCLLCPGSASPAGTELDKHPWLADAKTLAEASSAALGGVGAQVVPERLSQWTACYRIDHRHFANEGKDLAGGDLMYV